MSLSASPRFSHIGGLCMTGAMLASIPAEYTGSAVAQGLAGLFTILGLAAFFPRVTWGRRVFVLIGIALLLAAMATEENWRDHALTALGRASFIAAFFTALTAIRAAAMTSPSIAECGRFLAGQPPGRRYLALTLGGHLFGLVLIYGAIALLGSLATESAAKERNEELRRHRTRRMLLAIQRGFISTLPWSPLGFAMAISLTVVPDGRWAEALPACLVSTALLAGIGWALDTIFKPKLSAPPPPRGAAEGDWFGHLKPLLILLAVLIVLVAALHEIAGVRIVGAVMSVVPVIALLWVAGQTAGPATARLSDAGARAAEFARRDLPAYGPEIILLVMAGFIGAMGAGLAQPLMAASGIDLAALPAWAILVGLVWFVPLTGQLGMNPILAVSLFAPLLPSPEALGIAPEAMIVAITGGWALSGATSPFTASTLLIANFGQVRPVYAGLVWNGPYMLVSATALSVWAVVAGRLL
ncbi:hypothetical protein [Oceaniglobus roseus]|uniref:hypothetical protein n=1 Tax=Oceaniglobus roseus TaxID=1737570 RepID=UPI001FEC2EDC|nr:hypothetical protein [Kandeliimicrobium roseum]